MIRSSGPDRPGQGSSGAYFHGASKSAIQYYAFRTYLMAPNRLRVIMNFTFLKIPVQIRPTFWIFLLLFAHISDDPIDNLIVGCVMFVSLLVHEYGHALTALYYGAQPRITLEAFGGNASYSSRGISKRQDFFITLNGPLLESMLIMVSYVLLRSGVFAHHYYVLYALSATMILNALWLVLNLIPLEPLDGGKLLRYFLEKYFGEQGYKISLIIGLAAAAIVAPLLYNRGGIIFPVILAYFGYQNYQELARMLAQSRLSPYQLLMRGLEAVNSSDFEEAKKYFHKVVKSNDKQMKHSAIESLAKIYFNEDNRQQSYKLLLNADHDLLQEGKGLLCRLAFERNNYALVAKYSFDFYALEPTFETAILNSQTFASLNQPELAWGWLETASKFGAEYSEQVKELFSSSVYDPVREHASFKNLA